MDLSRKQGVRELRQPQVIRRDSLLRLLEKTWDKGWLSLEGDHEACHLELFAFDT